MNKLSINPLCIINFHSIKQIISLLTTISTEKPSLLIISNSPILNIFKINPSTRLIYTPIIIRWIPKESEILDDRQHPPISTKKILQINLFTLKELLRLKSIMSKWILFIANKIHPPSILIILLNLNNPIIRVFITILNKRDLLLQNITLMLYLLTILAMITKLSRCLKLK